MNNEKAGKMSEIVNDVLVVTTRKSFWASPEARVFPNRLYTTIFYGHSTNRFNSGILLLRVLLWMLCKRPQIVVVGSAVRVGRWLAWIKKMFRFHFKLIVTGHFFSDKLSPFIDRCIVYEKQEVALYGEPQKYVFTPLPSDGNFRRDTTPAAPPYIFSGGSSGRDFTTLLDAIKELPIDLHLVIPSPKTLNYASPLPSNCSVEYQMPLDDFLECIAHSLFVVVPLKDGRKPHGQTTILQAMALGKCVISNDLPANWDYITDGQEGILVPPTDVPALRTEITRLLKEPIRREQLGLAAKNRSASWTYAGFQQFLINLCEMVLHEK